MKTKDLISTYKDHYLQETHQTGENSKTFQDIQMPTLEQQALVIIRLNL